MITAEHILERWRVDGLDVHEFILRALHNDNWRWGDLDYAAEEAAQVEAFCRFLEMEPSRVDEQDRVTGSLLHAVVFEMGFVDNDPTGERVLGKILDKCLALGDVNAKNHSCQTPIFNAASPQVIDRLIASGADPNAQSVHGATPLMHLCQQPELVAALLRGGADLGIKDHYGWTAHDYARHFDAPETLALFERAANP